MIKSYLYIEITFVLLISLIFVSGCVGSSLNNNSINKSPLEKDPSIQTTYANDILPSEKYVAIEEKIMDTGYIISGSYPHPALAQPPIPFNYRGPLVSYPPNYPQVNESLNVLLGTNYQNESPEGLMTRLNVKGVYNFPDLSESGLVITGVDDNGTLQMEYDNMTIRLDPGETWTSPVTATRTETIKGIDYTYTAKYNTTYKVTNLGVYIKSNLTDTVQLMPG